MNRTTKSIIKVIGVGGGGGNAVTYMYKQGIEDVTFALCNTDHQAMENSPIPTKIQLGEKTTEGLGAGNNPAVGRAAAEESRDALRDLLDDGTKMVFVTAGMGGGTGTGAAPVIARIAQELGILTVGIVTLPFIFEGDPKIINALEGIEELSKYIDAILVINNERLGEIYPGLSWQHGFQKTDDVLKTAAQGIAEIITKHGHINTDFADVKRTLKNGGIAIMCSGYSDENSDKKIMSAIENALNSPLLYNNDIYSARKLLANIYFNPNENFPIGAVTSEMKEFTSKFGRGYEFKMGTSFDETLNGKVKVTILATGFGVSDIPGFDEMDKIRKEALMVDDERIKRYGEKIEKIYGTSSIVGANANYKDNIIILTPEQIAYSELLDRIDMSPTFSRMSKAFATPKESDLVLNEAE